MGVVERRGVSGGAKLDFYGMGLQPCLGRAVRTVSAPAIVRASRSLLPGLGLVTEARHQTGQFQFVRHCRPADEGALLGADVMSGGQELESKVIASIAVLMV